MTGTGAPAPRPDPGSGPRSARSGGANCQTLPVY